MKIVDEFFGCDVFGPAAMQRYLPHAIYKQMIDVMEHGKELPKEIADTVANAMKDWAMDKGATHYTHWFQPMTGITAEKHDAFINPTGPNSVISDFRGKELIKGEPDASSFPSGGLRATFEARGYTAWDPTSFAFVKEKTLYIPTLFCSYDGSSLDKKTPLLRSIDALDKAAVRLLNLMGYHTKKITITVGPEQEYFLIDENLFKQRLDLMVTGRTLFGAPPVKGQELDDHYFGNIDERVKAYMEEVDQELWKLGVFAKTEHKEVAPCQFELAPVFSSVNSANDQNQITMDVLKRVARHHGFVCLLHEKPFEGVNGSGKHNNWSFSTDSHENLLEPGDDPKDNIRFLTILAAIIKGVDEYQDLLRLSVASAGNDHRLGANEAPPAIISIYLGDELTAILEAIERGKEYVENTNRKLELGVSALPPISKDSTDRNRTSPFAFTGNKFEFRMLGSALNISCPNTILNTIVAEELTQFADELENYAPEQRTEHVISMIQKTLKEHKRILFSGNGYSEEWRQEAKKRGLQELKTTADALPHYTDPKNLAMFEKHKVYSANELHARENILLENYYQVVLIEARTMAYMLRKQILPAVFEYEAKLATIIQTKKASGINSPLEEKILFNINEPLEFVSNHLETLENLIDKVPVSEKEKAQYAADELLPLMEAIRTLTDSIEQNIPKDFWPLPDYNDLLFKSVQ
ncbi:glutamine synthetase III [Faecalicoccus pleomorphus]|uniref:glutamine synthetase III family protein n=1 Tax=Faecalicoccus pleomorphus TaxID=1323 RepID=UPI0019615A72|nr:glutamine synthetase III [Faecalicoccus pleomorphus]MBM6677334.1 glutamine synthetase III [Faecalicoccus pleomorphus]MDB7985877.1 glutamine synthetase III [Faecalicoccus pleomorphus]MDB7991644.1 glutamine synthetase III [Faecalicoccus pleomorphus]